MKKYRLEIFLFLSVWLVYGLAINSRNLVAFGLQQMGVEAIVERGHFYLEGSRVPQLQPLGDVFVYKGHKYAAKQPGQFLLGALVYFFLRVFGLTYQNHYLMTAALVTFLTASLTTALSVVALFRLARAMAREGSTLFWPLAAALLYGLGTIVFAYSGIAHHDAIATAFMLMAFYCAFRLSQDEPAGRRATWLAAAAGFFLGLTVTTSMLVFWPALAVALYFLWLNRLTLVPYFILGGVVGLAPLLIYDAVNFGNPFLLPNVAGNYRDTFFHLSSTNFLNKVRFYWRMTTGYAPVFLVGLAGLFFLPRAFRREQLAAVGAVVILCAYIFNIDTEGTCQYGPRYLLPVMAFGCLGLVGFTYLESSRARWASVALILLAGLFSLVVNAVGAAHGTMYCDLARHAFWPHWQAMRGGQMATFPLFSWLFIPTLLSLWALVKAVRENALGEQEPAVVVVKRRRK